MAFAPRIPHDARNDYEVQARRDGMEAFQISARNGQNRTTRAEDRDVYFPVYYIEPFTTNEHWLGLNLKNEPTWQATLQATCDTKLLKVTPPFRKTADDDNGDQCLVLAAHYDRNGVDYTVEGRRQNLKGYIVCLLSCTALVKKAIGHLQPHDIDTELVDVTDKSSPHTLFEQNLADESQQATAFVQQAVLEVGGREWLIRCRPTPAFLQGRGDFTPWVTLVSGFALTLLLTLYLKSQLQRTQKIEAEVHRRTIELKNENRIRKQTECELREREGILRTTFDSLQDGLCVLDTDLTVRHVNRTLEQWHAEQMPLIGRKCHSAFRNSVSPCHSCPAQRCIQTKRSETETVQIPSPTKKWFEIHCHPIIDERDGEVIGIIELHRDITDQRRAEADRSELQEKLIASSRQAGMAEVATGVLHNVGNVLNSVNVSAQLLAERTKESQVVWLGRATALIEEHLSDLAAYITTDAKGQHLPDYLCKLSSRLLEEREASLDELNSLVRNVEHIKEIVTRQQSYAALGGVAVEASLATLADDALKTCDGSLQKYKIEVKRQFDDVPPIMTDKHKVMQILINLISNAKHALIASGNAEKQVAVRVETVGTERVAVTVTDNGVGITTDAIDRVFNHGFTTKKDGHGFGLHSSSLAAKELGGALTVFSAGVGQGAAFKLELPLASPHRNKTAPSHHNAEQAKSQSAQAASHSHA